MMPINDNWHVHPGLDCCQSTHAAPAPYVYARPYVSVATHMPETWNTWTCAPCRATLAIGGERKPVVNCPGCGQPMTWLATHQSGAVLSA